MNTGSILKHQIYHFNGAKNSLGDLTYLCCDSIIDSAFFYGLSHVCINDNDYNEFEILLEKSLQLQKIVIDGSINQYSSSLLLEKLVNFAPKSLREIRIFNDWKISAYDLELFLENWRGRESIILYFFTDVNDSIHFNHHLLNILQKYREEGVIKNYRCDDEYQDFYFSW
uniref:F-box associated domain-containing protein n=1 Tax=Rhizophagus irregularis (strain DAOM 181602 / DAOM 197198 / MUCL 43194) TaxID=747089 RepID=U9SV87_RHIID